MNGSEGVDGRPPEDGLTVAVAGAKGGVGKTTTSTNLAACLARRGESVVLVEFDVATANFVDFLDLPAEDPSEASLHDVLAGDAALGDATYRGPGGMHVVPSGPTLEGFARTDANNVRGVVTELASTYDFVVVDTGASISRWNVEPLGFADVTLVVSTPRVASIRDTEKTKELVTRAGGCPAGLVLTKSGTGASPAPGRIAEFLDLDLLTHVPDDSAIPDSQDRGVPVVVAAPESDAARAYGELTATVRSMTSSGSRSGIDSVHRRARTGESKTDQQSVLARARDGNRTAKTMSDGRANGTRVQARTIGREEKTAGSDTAGESRNGDESEFEWGVRPSETAPATDSEIEADPGADDSGTTRSGDESDGGDSSDGSGSILRRLVSVVKSSE